MSEKTMQPPSTPKLSRDCKVVHRWEKQNKTQLSGRQLYRSKSQQDDETCKKPIVIQLTSMNRCAFNLWHMSPRKDVLERIYAYGNILAKTEPSEWNSVPIVYTIAEVLSYLTPKQKLTEENAEKLFKDNVYSILPLKDSIPFATSNYLSLMYECLDIDVSYRCDLPFTICEAEVTKKTYSGALSLLYIWKHSRNFRSRDIPIHICLYLLVAIACMGKLTTDYQTKIFLYTKFELGRYIKLNIDAVESVWEYMKNFIDDTNVEKMIIPWLSMIEPTAFNLREILQIKPYVGFPNAYIIIYAVTHFPSFSWSWVEVKFPEEAKALIILMKLVSENPLTSYAKNSLRLSDDHYPHIHYVAANLILTSSEMNKIDFSSVEAKDELDVITTQFLLRSSPEQESPVDRKLSKLVEAVACWGFPQNS